MRAKFIFENIENVLKPKDSEEIQRELDKMIKLVPTNVKSPNANSHYNNIIDFVKRGYDIRFYFENKTAETIYNRLNNLMVPFFQNGLIRDINGGMVDVKHMARLKKDTIYIKDFPPTSIGRHDIDSSITWNMSDSEKQLAKQLYKGKRNDEYAFFISEEVEICFIISKSGKYVTLVLELNLSEFDTTTKTFITKPNTIKDNKFIKQNFSKIPQFSDLYLNGGWKSINEIIEITKKLVDSIVK